MRNKNLLSIFILILFFSANAQNKLNLSLEQALKTALEKNAQVQLAKAKVTTKKITVETIRNNSYPDLKASAQYMRLSNANVSSKLGGNNASGNSNGASQPQVDQLILSQVNTTMPFFSGFKLKNSIKAAENLYKAEKALSQNTQEEIAYTVIEHYTNLYKTQKTITILTEQLKSAKQRVVDFEALENNGLLAHNDLLKTQLQVAKIEISLSEQQKNATVLNYSLALILALQPQTQFEINEKDFAEFQIKQLPENENSALENRPDFAALQYQEKAGNDNIKVANAGFYPSLALIGGYTYLDLKNAITVTNAINFGLGFSYDLSSIFKTKTQVNLAKSKVEEIKSAIEVASDQIKIQMLTAKENLALAQKQTLVYQKAETQAYENFRVVKDKFDNGLATVNELLDAETEYQTSTINAMVSTANATQKYYELLAVSGILTQYFNLNINE